MSQVRVTAGPVMGSDGGSRGSVPAVTRELGAADVCQVERVGPRRSRAVVGAGATQESGVRAERPIPQECGCGLGRAGGSQPVTNANRVGGRIVLSYSTATLAMSG